MKLKSTDTGKAVAAVLNGAWRASLPPLGISSKELEMATERLLATGAGALGWWRVRDSSLQTTTAAQQLHDAYRLHSLQDLQHEREIETVLTWLKEEAIEAILVKGWTIARQYPEPGLRPYGDIDLCVQPQDYARCRDLLIARQDGEPVNVDLHRGFRTLDAASWEELYSRSAEVRLGEVSARVLRAEDHLRVLCFHFLREGGWRPLWLCDIAVALESRDSGFDWKMFLGKDQRRASWMACAILLAGRLLGANLEGIPHGITDRRMPRWLVSCVLKEWGSPTMPKRHQSPMSNARQFPMLTLKGIPSHWPNPIEASISVNALPNNSPRLPFQLAQSIRRTVHLFRRNLSGIDNS